jgi:hypothetical protein
MFDVVIFADSAVAPAARTLSSLVEGVIADVIKRVIVVAPHEHEELQALADAAGCAIVTIPTGTTNRDILRQALSTDHILCLNAGAEMPQDWSKQMKTELAARGMPGTAVVVMFKPKTTSEWFKLVVRQSIKGTFSLNYGALVPQAILMASSLDGKAIKSKILPVHMSDIRVGYTPN